MSDLKKLADWIECLRCIADARRKWHELHIHPFTNMQELAVLEIVIGCAMVEVLP